MKACARNIFIAESSPIASKSPAPAPKTPSKTFSTNNWRMSLLRAAPTATRKDISRSRAIPRASKRPATFAQAISNTVSTAPSITPISDNSLPPVRVACNAVVMGISCALRPLSVAGYCWPISCMICAMSAWACCIVTSDVKRPTVINQFVSQALTQLGLTCMGV